MTSRLLTNKIDREYMKTLQKLGHAIRHLSDGQIEADPEAGLFHYHVDPATPRNHDLVAHYGRADALLLLMGTYMSIREQREHEHVLDLQWRGWLKIVLGELETGVDRAH